MSTKLSTDLSWNRSSTRLHAPPGGHSSINIFGGSENPTPSINSSSRGAARGVPPLALAKLREPERAAGAPPPRTDLPDHRVSLQANAQQNAPAHHTQPPDSLHDEMMRQQQGKGVSFAPRDENIPGNLQQPATPYMQHDYHHQPPAVQSQHNLSQPMHHQPMHHQQQQWRQPQEQHHQQQHQHQQQQQQHYQPQQQQWQQQPQQQQWQQQPQQQQQQQHYQPRCQPQQQHHQQQPQPESYGNGFDGRPAPNWNIGGGAPQRGAPMAQQPQHRQWDNIEQRHHDARLKAAFDTAEMDRSDAIARKSRPSVKVHAPPGGRSQISFC